LTINNSTSGSENVTACDSYTWSANSTTYTASGMYTATLTNAAGCDSLATLNLTINNSTSGSENVTACDSYTWSANSTTYTTSGTYTATLTNAAGCDSTATLNLTINNSTSGSENVTACNNYTWSANSTTYTSSGTYTATLTNAAGCDSIATLNLTITTFATGTDVITACDSYTWIDGITYTASNNTATFTIVGGSVNGCDSIVSLDLTVNYSTSGSENVTACDSYTWSANSTTYTTSGTYTATLTNAAGCDSTATLNLTINNSTSGSETVTACDSYTWSANATTYTASGTYTATLTNAAGCDSIATLNLTINNSTSGSETVTACDSYTWSANSTTYTTSGTYTTTLTNAAGCDSTATLNLTINNSSSSLESAIACDSYTWAANGMTYTSSGNYTAVLTNAAGCDSTVFLSLTINNSTSGSQNITTCNSYTWSANSTTYTTSGTYTTTLTNAAGCDSTATLNLTITTFATGTDVITACDSYTWIDGITYTTSNNTATYTIVGGSVNGCDSIVALDLTINNSTSGSETATSCGPYTWAANGTTYASSGTFTTILTGSNGCDSTATLFLTVNNPTSGSETVTACDTYTWSANGTTYTSSGTYTAVLTGSNGCDSTATLNLTINTATSGSESVTTCDSYTWSANSTTYTTSGTYTATLTNTAGCDSTATLNLTINNSSTGSETAVACGSYTWATNGMTYTSSGAYTAVLTNTQGCDSTVTLNLTINSPTSGSESVTACNSYTWSANGTTYTVGGAYTATLTGSNGCDSTATLNLTINNSTSGSETASACEFYTWPTSGMTYTSTGTYTTTLVGSNGCDSVVTLNLTINTPTTGTETATVCDQYVWAADGNTYTATGTYTAILTNAAGCDSIVTLDLTVQGLPTVTLALTTQEFCDSDADISLVGGSPAGGTYSGTGVSGGMFSPSTAGIGSHTITYSYTDANGCSATDTDVITVQDCASIDELEETIVTIYPNPTTGNVTFVSNGAALEAVRIFDNAGKLVDVITLGGATHDIDITDYARGVYQLEITAGTSVYRERVVKN
ncbi:MAG: T9SS type A sorting domain-containing protein, partial [bacterium]|nr:T9SS type A sorting domain-containing protein [bacterium]